MAANNKTTKPSQTIPTPVPSLGYNEAFMQQMQKAFEEQQRAQSAAVLQLVVASKDGTLRGRNDFMNGGLIGNCHSLVVNSGKSLVSTTDVDGEFELTSEYIQEIIGGKVYINLTEPMLELVLEKFMQVPARQKTGSRAALITVYVDSFVSSGANEDDEATTYFTVTSVGEVVNAPRDTKFESKEHFLASLKKGKKKTQDFRKDSIANWRASNGMSAPNALTTVMDQASLTADTSDNDVSQLVNTLIG